MNFPSEINLVSLNYFNCESVEVISFWSEWKEKKRERKKKKKEITFSLSCLFLDS